MKPCTMLLAGLTIPAVFAVAQPPAKPDAKQPAARATDTAFGESMRAQETRVWESIAHQDWAAFGAFLADDFVEVTPGGFVDKAATLVEVKSGKLSRYTLSDWRTTKLGETGAIVMYKVDDEWTGADGKVAHDVAYCTSVWSHQGAKWVAISHQETSAPKEAADKKAADKKPDAPKPASN